VWLGVIDLSRNSKVNSNKTKKNVAQGKPTCDNKQRKEVKEHKSNPINPALSKHTMMLPMMNDKT